MIGIRADGNNKIGLGHIMRCLTIAKALKKQGGDVLFILADETCSELLLQNGFQYCVLNSAYDDLEKETDSLISILREHKIDRLLVDTYYVTPNYLEELRKAVIMIYLDDVNAFAYPVDLLINYNIFAAQEQYSYTCATDDAKTDVKERTMLLSGASYAPVRDEFQEYSKEAGEEVKDILLSLGGSDAYNLSCKIILRLVESGEWNIHTVCGPFNAHKEELKALADKNPGVFVYENVKEMWKLMNKCDLAVSAAGSTMYELSVAGIPVVTFSFVENQRKIAEGFAEKKAAVSAEHYHQDEEEAFLERIERLVCRLTADCGLRKELVNNAKTQVDGRGAERIAKEILEYER